MPFQRYPNLAKEEEGFNPFQNLSEKLNRNRDEFFDGFLMGGSWTGRKTDQTAGERSIRAADTLRASQTKTDFSLISNSDIHGMLPTSADKGAQKSGKIFYQGRGGGSLREKEILF